MRRDFKKNAAARSRNSSADKRPLFVAIGALTLVVGFIGFGFYQYKHQPQRFVALTDCYQKLSSWMAERKQHLNQSIKVVKQIAVKETADQPVHFEFYTALPSMKMEVATSENVAAQASVPIARKALTTVTTTPTPVETKASNPSEPATSSTEMKLKSPFVSADELERQMSRELDTATQYVLQLGIFRAADAAEKLRDALVTAGFRAVVSKVAGKDKELYRVQLGPYLNKTQAQQAQAQLEKRGMSSLLRKIELS